MVKGIDFGRLSLRDALDLAILVEDEARERYEEFADQMEIHHTPEAAAFFKAMMGNEIRHGAELAIQRRALFREEPSSITREMIWDVEAPDYDSTRAFMSVRQAMEVALRSEIKAYDYFGQALKHVVNPAVRKLFEDLQGEELVHQDLVKRELAKLPPGPVINPDDYADDPVAQ